MSDFIFLGSKITADGDYSHEIKRRLLLGRKAMISLDSIFGEGNGTPLQYSCLENSINRGAWQATVHGVKKSVSQFSRSVVSDSLWPHELQHTRPPCPSPTPRVTQTHVHWVGDAIQPSHPLLSPPSPVGSLSQHQGLFKWVSSLHQVAKLLEFQLQHQSFQWTPRTDLL